MRRSWTANVHEVARHLDARSMRRRRGCTCARSIAGARVRRRGEEPKAGPASRLACTPDRALQQYLPSAQVAYIPESSRFKPRKRTIHFSLKAPKWSLPLNDAGNKLHIHVRRGKSPGLSKTIAPKSRVAAKRRYTPCPVARGMWALYATSTHAPPTALIFFSASLLNTLAFTTSGWSGSSPPPSTLK